MATYIPSAFAGSQDDARRLIDRYPFAVLLTQGKDAPQVSHLPLLFEARDGGDVLVGHVAKANPQVEHLDASDAVAIFQGPHAYVSPRWYPDPAVNVPTWNFVAVHVHGILRRLDAERTHALMRRLEQAFDPQLEPMALRMPSVRRAALLGGIVGFELAIRQVDVKLKLSQNKSAADREGVIAGLRGENQEELLSWMLL